MTGAAKARWLLVVLAWTGGPLGALGLPWIHSVIAPAQEHGGWQAVSAILFVFWIYWLLLRTAWDMVTDISNYLRRDLDEPGEYDHALVDDRLSWGLAITYWWTVIEQCSLFVTAAAFVILGWSHIDQIRGSTWLGFTALGIAFHSAILRNAAPVFPLPCRWCGLKRYWTDAEGQDLRWPWSDRAGLDRL
jgi:hypothetical protein